MRTATPVRVVGTAIALSLGISGAAHASEPLGEITSIKGSALISQGAQYVPARAGMSLRELDRVVIMEDSSATVAFADGCDYMMGEMDLLTVSPKSPCQASGAGASESDVLSKATTMVCHRARAWSRLRWASLVPELPRVALRELPREWSYPEDWPPQILSMPPPTMSPIVVLGGT